MCVHVFVIPFSVVSKRFITLIRKTLLMTAVMNIVFRLWHIEKRCFILKT